MVHYFIFICFNILNSLDTQRNICLAYNTNLTMNIYFLSGWDLFQYNRMYSIFLSFLHRNWTRNWTYWKKAKIMDHDWKTSLSFFLHHRKIVFILLNILYQWYTLENATPVFCGFFQYSLYILIGSGDWLGNVYSFFDFCSVRAFLDIKHHIIIYQLSIYFF